MKKANIVQTGTIPANVGFSASSNNLPTQALGIIRGLAHQIVARAEGFTYSLPFDKFAKRGFAVSLLGYEKKIEGFKDLQTQQIEKAIADYWKENGAALFGDNVYIGAWVNMTENALYLDVTQVIKDYETARAVAIHNKQLAFFNLHDKREILL